MKESASGRIKIEDVSSVAVERMIGFIYTGDLSFGKAHCNMLSDNLITELLHYADKYGIPEMKQEVLEQMQKLLSSRNAIRFLKVAEIYAAGDSLGKEILDFCKK